MTSSEDMETPGFGFNPTEEQLVNYYLRNKICGNDDKVSAIADIGGICNYEPWELPKKAAIPSQDTWYFFSRPDRKYKKSGNNNRVTRAGYWKVTGKPREIKNRAKNQVLGIKRILVFYEGRVRDPLWTQWTMHEYQLNPSSSNGTDYVISRLHKKTPRKRLNSSGDESEPGHDSASEVENPGTDFTLPEIDPQFEEDFRNSYKQGVTSPTAQLPELYYSQGPSNVYHQHTNGAIDDYIMPLSQFGSGYQQYNNIEAVKSHQAIQDAQYYSGSMHTTLDDSSPSESLVHIGDSDDTEAVRAMADGFLWGTQMMQGLSYENFQKKNCVADEYDLLSPQFGASGQQDMISEMVSSYPTIQDIHLYPKSMEIAPSDSSPSEYSASLPAKDMSDAEVIDEFITNYSDSDWPQWFERTSACFSYTRK
ncbi:NAC transcription factor 29-like [Tripterygium wilfordii]|uniref:NAC transcription factor 29-like n=1 Tax=Tripterygium wilfordii TaxID=458696 RepID=UPI0018F7F024|nr:NAC transcription factor 29-like [Tripterygium wilfordii]